MVARYKILPTKKQKEMLDYIKDYSEDKGSTPTLKEMADRFDISITTVVERLDALERKGLIRRLKNRWRGIICG